MKDYKKQFWEIGVVDGIKIQEELSELLNGLHTAVVEPMLHREIDAQLGYPKPAKSDSANDGNSTSKKKLKSHYGQMDLKSSGTVSAPSNP